jgi:hypothetical protein
MAPSNTNRVSGHEAAAAIAPQSEMHPHPRQAFLEREEPPGHFVILGQRSQHHPVQFRHTGVSCAEAEPARVEPHRKESRLE